MIAVLLATLAATLTAIGAWALDQWLLRCGTVFRAAVATGLMALSTWVGTLIQAAIWLKTPGAYGPVQFWSSDEAAMAFMSGPRALSLFLPLPFSGRRLTCERPCSAASSLMRQLYGSRQASSGRK